MGSKLSISKFSPLGLRTNFSAMMLILGSCSKLACATAATRRRAQRRLPRPFKDAPSNGSVQTVNTHESITSVSWSAQWERNDALTEAANQANRCMYELLEEEAARNRAESAEARDSGAASARSSAAGAPTVGAESPAAEARPSTAAAPPSVPTDVPADEHDPVVSSPTVDEEDAMSFVSQDSIRSVPRGRMAPPGFERIDTNESDNEKPHQIDFSRFLFFRRWIQAFEAEQEANSESIKDEELKAQIKTAMVKADFDATGFGTATQESGIFRFPDYERALRRLLDSRRTKAERDLRRAQQRAARRAQAPRNKKPDGGAPSFDFNSDIAWFG